MPNQKTMFWVVWVRGSTGLKMAFFGGNESASFAFFTSSLPSPFNFLMSPKGGEGR